MGAEGYILLHKPSGITSFDVLRPIKRSLGTRALGHTGTLDKFASGLMILLVGKATKLTDAIHELDKSYLASFFFGIETDTLDPEGQQIAKGEIPAIFDIQTSTQTFLGEQWQHPPKYSAVHIHGVRASDLARQGKEVQTTAKKVRITRFDHIEGQGDTHRFIIDCGTGTYIRSLARDLAHKLGTVAYVTQLSRVRIGPFLLSQAKSPEEITGKDVHSLDSLVSLLGWHQITLPQELSEKVRKGWDLKYLNLELKEGWSALYDTQKVLLALVQTRQHHSKYGVLL